MRSAQRDPAAHAQRHLPAGARAARGVLHRQARGARRRGRPARIHRAGDRDAAAPPRRPDAAARQGHAAGGRRIHESRCWRRPRCSSSSAFCRPRTRRRRRAWLDDNPSAAPRSPPQFERPLPARPPGFCIGCPERPVFAALKLAQQEIGPVHIAADIGCHAFGTFEPFSSGHSILGYGMSLASARRRRADDAAAHPVDHGRRRLLAQRPAHRRAVGALQPRRRRCC